jgi:hypothetical protein
MQRHAAQARSRGKLPLAKETVLTALGRMDAVRACFRDGRSWRSSRVAPSTTFRSIPAVRRTNLEWALRIETAPQFPLPSRQSERG